MIDGRVEAQPFSEYLAPVDLLDLIEGMSFLPWQVQYMTGLTRDRLDYWTTKAGIAIEGKAKKLYPLESVELVALIKQGVDAGLGLDVAILAARDWQRREGRFRLRAPRPVPREATGP